MTKRFEKLTKIPQVPAAKLLADAHVTLKTPLTSPASASAETVLAELDSKGAWTDILMLMAVLLPARERVWWACLAARDYIGPKSDQDPRPLVAAEAWVFKPTDEFREEARRSMDHADVDDDTTNCALSVVYCDETLGPGELSKYPAPAGAAQLTAFAMNVVALGKLSDKFETYKDLLIDRAIDIARGGNGRVVLAAESTQGGA